LAKPKVEVIDFFCGVGGVTEGVEASECARVIACLNHDPQAIVNHSLNYPHVVHHRENIRTFNPERMRNLFSPGAVRVGWFSPDCTGYSKANGGRPRKADSRTLANQIFKFEEVLNFDYIYVENVEEFRSWGDLDENGKPLSRDKGKKYMQWLRKMKSYGFKHSERLLSAADYGGATIRTRLFIQFAKGDLPIAWPDATHGPSGEDSLFKLKPYVPVKEVLNFENEGESIFNRTNNINLRVQDRHDLSPNTYDKLLKGLIKHVVPTNDKNFIIKYNGNNKSKGKTKLNRGNSINEPALALLTECDRRLVKVKTIDDYLLEYNGKGAMHKTSKPAGAVTTKDRLYKVKVNYFVHNDYTNGQNTSVNKPSQSIVGNPKQNLVRAEQILNSKDTFLLDPSYNGHALSVDNPGPVVLASRNCHYVVSTNYGMGIRDTDKPCFTIIARQDKSPAHLLTTKKGDVYIKIEKTDSKAIRRLKLFMAAHGIIDIKMRQLEIEELLQIQGFPKTFKMKGSKSIKKKHIGNSVHTHIPKNLFRVLYKNLPDCPKKFHELRYRMAA